MELKYKVIQDPLSHTTQRHFIRIDVKNNSMAVAKCAIHYAEYVNAPKLERKIKIVVTDGGISTTSLVKIIYNPVAVVENTL